MQHELGCAKRIHFNLSLKMSKQSQSMSFYMQTMFIRGIIRIHKQALVVTLLHAAGKLLIFLSVCLHLCVQARDS